MIFIKLVHELEFMNLKKSSNVFHAHAAEVISIIYKTIGKWLMRED